MSETVFERTGKIADMVVNNKEKFGKWADKKYSEGKPDEFFKTFSELSKDAGF
jgi:hypothetical protein